MECDAVRERGLAAEKQRGRIIPRDQIFDLRDALGGFAYAANEDNEERTSGGRGMKPVEDKSREFFVIGQFNNRGWYPGNASSAINQLSFHMNLK